MDQIDYTTPRAILDSARDLHIKADSLLKSGKLDEGKDLRTEVERAYNNLLNRNFEPGVVLSLLAVMDQKRGWNGRCIGLAKLALAHLMNRLEKEPDNKNIAVWLAMAWNAIAIANHDEGYDSEAEKAFAEAEKWTPESADLYASHASLYINNGHPQKCIDLINKARALDPELKDHHWNLALAHLELGHWKIGFDLYHQGVLGKERLNLNYWASGKTPVWDGSPDKTVVVYGEQGVGDEIMFASCLPDAIKDCKQVILDCHPRLEKLFRRSFPSIEIHGTRKSNELDWAVERGGIDAAIAIGSLPMYYRSRDTSFPAYTNGYLRVDPDRVAHYRSRMKALGPGPYIGIAWCGGTKKTRYDLRSIGLQDWQTILRQDARFLSVHYMPGAGADAAKYDIPHWQDAIDDLDEQAALVRACDLVISVNQTVVHLAGALAKRTWVLTPSKPAWRYGLTGERMIWYPTIRQFRQKDGEPWTPTLNRLTAELKGFIRKHNEQVAGDRGSWAEPERAEAG